MRVLGFIPARGGSKGLPGKNLVPLAGRPLIAYTCDAARQSSRLARVVVSTDDPEIARVAASCGVDVPFMRPRELARDDTPMIDVVRHALAELDRRGDRFDAVAVLQPTSPLRRAEHIDAVVDLLCSSRAATAVSVVRVPHQFTPGSLMRLEGDELVAYDAAAAPLRRQDKPALFARNGPAVLIVTRDAIAAGTFYGSGVVGYEMPSGDSIDIDTMDDVDEAEYRLQRRSAARGC
jgi:CMP-N,N'-diacetyllegionaminic acid synthase